jgi:hypothetical protein
MDAVSTEPAGISPRTRRRHGIAAVVERDALAIGELTVESGVTLHRAAVARNGESIDWRTNDAESVAAALATMLERAGLPNRIDALALSQSLFGATCTVVPPVKGETLAAVLGRRMKEVVSDAQGEWLIDHAPIGNPGDEEASVVPSVIAWADRAAIESIESALRARRVDVRRIVPPMVGLLNLLGNEREPGATGAVLVVHVSLPSLCIFLFDGEDLLYVRPMRDVLAAAPEQLPEVVQTEVQRTAAYFRENQRGRRVEQILVSGLPRANAERFSKWLAASVGSPSEPFAVALTAPIAVDVDADALAAHLPILAGALLPGMRARLAKSRPMNLLADRPRRLPLYAAAAGLVFAGIFGAAWEREIWSRQAATQQHLVDRLGRELAQLQSGSAHRAEELAAARRFGEERDCLAKVGADSNPVQPALEAMLLVPPELSLVGTRLTRPAVLGATREQGDGARLELRVRGDFTRRGPQLVDQMVASLQSRPWCADAHALATSGSGGELLQDDEVRVEVALR